MDDAAAGTKIAEVKNSLDDTYFAWAGATTNGGQVYFRIQGPAVFIEYATQGKGTDHIHTILRDPTQRLCGQGDDSGAGWLDASWRRHVGIVDSTAALRIPRLSAQRLSSAVPGSAARFA